MKNTLLVSALISSASAFPWVASMPGVDSSLLRKRQQTSNGPGSAAQCPFNSNHTGAAPYNSKYPYAGAKDGLPATNKGGYYVPAPGDTAHEFVAPGPNDIRGPCPGLNTAANHNFLSHDGIVTFNELLDAQQNVYNVGYDLALTLALLGLTTTDGDPVTEKLSIGCDATTRTSFSPALTGSEPGLDGHNKFEADTSLTRNDYFLADGDNFSMNATLFSMMVESTGGTFGRDQLAKYRYERYQQSLADNPNFFFGPLSLLLFGASSFLYELMPSGTHNYEPDLETISSFFGASQDKDGEWYFNGHEQIPANWTNRVEPYSSTDVVTEILAQYLEYPVLFGGNTANGSFDTISFGDIKDGQLSVNVNKDQTACLLYQLFSSVLPGSLNSVITPSVNAVSLVLKELGGIADNLGCPIALT